MCKLSPKEVAVELPPVLVKLTLIFLHLFEAIISPVINVKTFPPFVVVVIFRGNTIEQKIFTPR